MPGVDLIHPELIQNQAPSESRGQEAAKRIYGEDLEEDKTYETSDTWLTDTLSISVGLGTQWLF